MGSKKCFAIVFVVMAAVISGLYGVSLWKTYAWSVVKIDYTTSQETDYVGFSLQGRFESDSYSGGSPDKFKKWEDVPESDGDFVKDCKETATNTIAVVSLALVASFAVFVTSLIAIFAGGSITRWLAKLSMLAFLIAGVILPAAAAIYWWLQCHDSITDTADELDKSLAVSVEAFIGISWYFVAVAGGLTLLSYYFMHKTFHHLNEIIE